MRKTLQVGRGVIIPAGVLGLLVLATGCSSHATISGKVTYLGKPLTGGIVLFVSADGKGTGRATIGSDGSYKIEKMPLGLAKIAVDTQSAQRPASGGKGPPAGMKPPPGTKLPDAAKNSGIYGSGAREGNAEPIPENYADPEKSGLTYTVKSGSQPYDIELK